MARQVAEVEERIARHQRLLEALSRCTRSLDDGSHALDEALLGIITATRLCEESLTPDEHRRIAEARSSFSTDEVEALQAETAALTKKMEAARRRGADPAGAPVQALMRSFMEIRERIAGKDKAFHDKIRRIAAQSPALLRASGVTPELAAYVRQAREALEGVQAPAAAKARRPARSAR